MSTIKSSLMERTTDAVVAIAHDIRRLYSNVDVLNNLNGVTTTTGANKIVVNSTMKNDLVNQFDVTVNNVTTSTILTRDFDGIIRDVTVVTS